MPTSGDTEPPILGQAGLLLGDLCEKGSPSGLVGIKTWEPHLPNDPFRARWASGGLRRPFACPRWPRPWAWLSKPLLKHVILSLMHPFFKGLIYLFLEREEERAKERERNINVWLLLKWPPLGTWPTTQTCALTGNRTGFAACAESTELHQPGPKYFKNLYEISPGWCGSVN